MSRPINIVESALDTVRFINNQIDDLEYKHARKSDTDSLVLQDLKALLWRYENELVAQSAPTNDTESMGGE